MCVCVCACACLCACVCVWLCLCLCVCVSVFVSVLCVCVCMCVCMCVYVCAHAWVSGWVGIFVRWAACQQSEARNIGRKNGMTAMVLNLDHSHVQCLRPQPAREMQLHLDLPCVPLHVGSACALHQQERCSCTMIYPWPTLIHAYLPRCLRQ